jgi:hypothetical protein
MVTIYLFRKIYSFLNWNNFCQCFLVFIIHGFRSLFTLFLGLMVDPLKCLLPILEVHVTILNDLSHLSVEECVSNDHFLLLQVLLKTFALE